MIQFKGYMRRCKWSKLLLFFICLTIFFMFFSLFPFFFQFSYIDFLYEVITSNEITFLKSMDNESSAWPSQEELSRCFSVWRMEGELNTGKTWINNNNKIKSETLIQLELYYTLHSMEAVKHEIKMTWSAQISLWTGHIFNSYWNDIHYLLYNSIKFL